jgi:hypothetical protein
MKKFAHDAPEDERLHRIKERSADLVKRSHAAGAIETAAGAARMAPIARYADSRWRANRRHRTTERRRSRTLTFKPSNNSGCRPVPAPCVRSPRDRSPSARTITSSATDSPRRVTQTFLRRRSTPGRRTTGVACRGMSIDRQESSTRSASARRQMRGLGQSGRKDQAARLDTPDLRFPQEVVRRPPVGAEEPQHAAGTAFNTPSRRRTCRA